MRQKKFENPDPAFVEEQLRRMADGLAEAMRREVDRRRREGLPIHVSDNGKVIDINRGGSRPS